MDLHKHNISLSDRQKNRLRIAYKKRRGVTVGLTADQLSKGNPVLLTDEQQKAVNKARGNKKGLRLTISYDQLLKNKEGGLLNEVLEFIEDNIPYAKKITPLIRKQAAPAIKEYVVPWLKDWINNELDNVIKGKEGSGLDAKTIQYVRDHMTKAADKKKKLNH